MKAVDVRPKFTEFKEVMERMSYISLDWWREALEAWGYAYIEAQRLSAGYEGRFAEIVGSDNLLMLAASVDAMMELGANVVELKRLGERLIRDWQEFGRPRAERNALMPGSYVAFVPDEF